MSDCSASAQTQHKTCLHLWNETNLFDIYHHQHRRHRSLVFVIQISGREIFVPCHMCLVNTRFASCRPQIRIYAMAFRCVCFERARAHLHGFHWFSHCVGFYCISSIPTKWIYGMCALVCRKANAKFHHKENGNGIHLWQLFGEGDKQLCVGGDGNGDKRQATSKNDSSSSNSSREIKKRIIKKEQDENKQMWLLIIKNTGIKKSGSATTTFTSDPTREKIPPKITSYLYCLQTIAPKNEPCLLAGTHSSARLESAWIAWRSEYEKVLEKAKSVHASNDGNGIGARAATQHRYKIHKYVEKRCVDTHVHMHRKHWLMRRHTLKNGTVTAATTTTTSEKDDFNNAKSIETTNKYTDTCCENFLPARSLARFPFQCEMMWVTHRDEVDAAMEQFLICLSLSLGTLSNWQLRAVVTHSHRHTYMPLDTQCIERLAIESGWASICARRAFAQNKCGTRTRTSTHRKECESVERMRMKQTYIGVSVSTARRWRQRRRQRYPGICITHL